MGPAFAHAAGNGPLLLAIGAAALAGLVSFLSPCVLPLVPGYLSYVTGLAGADLTAPSRRGRVLGGVALFVAGFSAVFILTGVLVAEAGRQLLLHQRAIEVAVGALVILLGLAFAGVIPLQRQLRPGRLPAAGLAGAPVLGAVFALSWTPCVGPTLAAVLSLAAVSGETGRAVTLTAAYCLGLGLPFLAFGLGFRRLLGLFTAIRRNSVWVTRIGGALLVLVGVALITGGWTDFVNWLRATVGPGTAGL